MRQYTADAINFIPKQREKSKASLLGVAIKARFPLGEFVRANRERLEQNLVSRDS